MFKKFAEIINFLNIFSLRFLLSKVLSKNSMVIDIGCGYSSTIKVIKKPIFKVGLDFYKPYIYESRKKKIHNYYIIADVRSLPLRSKSFDYAIAIEVIEHLKKYDGLKMIKEMERVAKRKIILTTPNGFLPAYAGPKDNPEERHLSGWYPNEFKMLGFKVYGINGLKKIWKLENGVAVTVFKFKPAIIFFLFITQVFVHFFPKYAFQLFCVKDANKI